MHAVEASGIAAVGRQAVVATHPQGTTLLLGAPPFGSELTLDWNSLLGGRTVRGALVGGANPHHFIPRVVELFRQGRFPLDRISRTYLFADIATAVDDSDTGATVKPILVMPSPAP